ncbi:MAG: aminopeptidase [Planctomycetota bacterium]|jgi:aminopeptidase
MMDPRLNDLAKILINYCTSLKRGEKVLIESVGGDPQMIVALIRAARARGGIPLVEWKEPVVMREFLRGATEEGIKLTASFEKSRMKKVDAYIGIRSGRNIYEMSDVPPQKLKLYSAHWVRPVHLNIRVNETKWVVLRYPTPSMAQQARMSTEAFEDFYFKVCTLDYRALSRAMTPLKRRMDRAREVHIKGKGTDLKFSIAGIPVIKCAGEMNIPDGEIFTAPVKNSINGVVSFNSPSVYEGTSFENIRLEFENGKVKKATCNETTRLNRILDSDGGARYVGEFAIGVNPYVIQPMRDTLFDEKIAGSFHMALGNAYESEADNGNRSQIHWDLVCIQTPDYGGGEIFFDGKLIRRNGKFVPKDLKPLDRVR